MSRVLVVAAHPDDEAIGCGGTLAGHAARGDEVQVVFLADGESSRDGGDISARRQMAIEAGQILGTLPPLFLGLPDNRLDSLPLLDVVQHLEAVALPYAPTVVYTHHGTDLNIDHRIAHQATLTAFRPQPGSPVRAIYSFEVNSSTEWQDPNLANGFSPQHYVDISQYWKKKAAALNIYGKELRPFPHSRSIATLNHLAHWRGSSVGLEMAEAFITIRSIS